MSTFTKEQLHKKINAPMFQIRNDLIEAYKGYYEDGPEGREVQRLYEIYAKENDPNWQPFVTWFDNWVRIKILTDSPKERLERYLEWNGIIGYSSTVFDIATGNLS